MHYKRLMVHGDPNIVLQPKNLSLIDRFNRFVIRGSECWDWSGKLSDSGYAQLFYNGKWSGGHRLSWLLHKNTPIGDLHVLHKCDNPKCTNPDHLFLGTNADNVSDKVKKGRQYRVYPPICSINGCMNKSRKLGLCNHHYNKQYFLLKLHHD